MIKFCRNFRFSHTLLLNVGTEINMLVLLQFI